MTQTQQLDLYQSDPPLKEHYHIVVGKPSGLREVEMKVWFEGSHLYTFRWTPSNALALADALAEVAQSMIAGGRA